MAPRAKRNAADVKAVDKREVASEAVPSPNKIPESLFPLTTKAAQQEYDTLAKLLFDRGKLTLAAHRALSSYSMQFDTITDAAATGTQVRGSWFAQLDKALKELGLDDIDKPIAASKAASPNKFSHTGFANRRR